MIEPSVTLDRVWIHDGDDHADRVSGRSATAPQRTSANVDVRLRANGRYIARSTPGRPRELTYTVGPVPRTVFDWLDARCGRTVMVRDGVGRVLWGVYDQLDDQPVKGHVERCFVTFTVRAISRTAEV